MKLAVLRHLRCDASGASQPAGIVKALGRNSSAHVVRFIRFGVASFVVCVRRLESSILCVRLPAPAQRRCLACCFRARTAALFSLLCCAAPSSQLAPTLFSLVGNLTSGAFQPR